MRTRITIATATALGAGLLLAVATPLAASAHVSITPDSAEPGSYSTVTVRVPNESETASTVQLDLTLPSDTPISSVRYVPMPGWTTKTEVTEFDPAVAVGDTEVTEAVTKISWTADDGYEIGAGQFQEFTVSLGPLPEVESLVLAADQHYSDGEVVSWSEGGEDAEHPAPVLYVTGAAPADHHAAAAVEATASETPANTSSPDVLARVLGIAGLVVGAIGVAFGLASRRRPAAK
jgi:uncharacterized protein YcnI